MVSNSGIVAPTVPLFAMVRIVDPLPSLLILFYFSTVISLLANTRQKVQDVQQLPSELNNNFSHF